MVRQEGEATTLTRRELLRLAALTAAYATVGSKIQSLFLEQEKLPGQRYFPPRLGVNINLKHIRELERDLGLDPRKEIILNAILSLPGITDVRAPIPFDEAVKEGNKVDVRVAEPLLEKVRARGMNFHIQISLLGQSIGTPEVHLTNEDQEKHSDLLGCSARLDADPDFRERNLEFVAETSQYYFGQYARDLTSVQLGNEQLSKRLPVHDYRYTTPEFYKEALSVLQEFNPGVPVLQNLPLDTPERIWDVLKYSDIVGLNIYNQHRLAFNFHGHEIIIPESFFWKGTDLAVAVSKALGKGFYVTEAQWSEWFGEPFSPRKRLEGLIKMLMLRPNAIFGWDVETLVYHFLQGKKEDWEFLQKLPEIIEGIIEALNKGEDPARAVFAGFPALSTEPEEKKQPAPPPENKC